MYHKILSRVRVLLWNMFFGVRIKYGSSIGPFSYLSIKKGRFFSHGVFHARKSFQVVVESGVLEIGSNVFFNSDVSINVMNKVYIGNNTLIGECVKFYDHDHVISKERDYRKSGFISSQIYVGDNVWIGSGCIILKGVKIHNGAVIGAGSLVYQDVPENSLFINKRITEVKKK